MKKTLIVMLALACAAGAQAASEEVTLHETTAQGIGAAIGTVTLSETPYGVQFTPALSGLKPGIHGFHVHAKGSCEPGESDGKTVAAGAAGGHLDPQKKPASILARMLMVTLVTYPRCLSQKMARRRIRSLRHASNP